MDNDFIIANEPIIPNDNFDKKAKTFKNKFKVENFRSIFNLSIQIFLQLFLALLITQLNSLMFGWYDNRTYLSVVNKITIFYNTFQFIPSLVASGALIVANNYLGQGRSKELGTIVCSGIVVNLLVTSIVVLFTNLFSKQFFEFLDIDTTSKVSYNDGSNVIVPQYYQYNEMDFARKYFSVYSIQLLFLGVAQVYIAGLQSIKKQMNVTIGAVSSNIIDVLIIAIVLYAFKADPIYCSFSIFIATIFQMIYMGIVFHIKVKNYEKFFKRFKFRLMISITKIGLPITLEMGLWNICNFATQSALSLGTGPTLDLGESGINIHRAIWSLSQYSTAFLQAMGTVTSMYVAKKVGEGNLEGAYREGLNCWKLSAYMQIGLSTIMFIFVYPYLLLMNIESRQIFEVGFYLYALIFVKNIFDTVNLTILRALWAVGDLWFPLIVSFFTFGLFLAAGPFLISKFLLPTLQKNHDIHSGAHIMMAIYGELILDPFCRTIIYSVVWVQRKWEKYAKKL